MISKRLTISVLEYAGLYNLLRCEHLALFTRIVMFDINQNDESNGYIC